MNKDTLPLPQEFGLKEGDILICMIDEWRDGKKHAFDGNVTYATEDGVDVCYLSGYRSRNDFVPWEDIVAKVDTDQPYRDGIADGAFSGHFVMFHESDRNYSA